MSQLRLDFFDPALRFLLINLPRLEFALDLIKKAFKEGFHRTTILSSLLGHGIDKRQSRLDRFLGFDPFRSRLSG